MFQRWLMPALRDAVADTPVVFLNGPRQAGKSTFASELIASGHPATYHTLDDPLVRESILRDPVGYITATQGPMVLDEVQRARDELALPIKLVVDRDREPGRFLLTGSANVLLLPGFADALAGRMEIITLWPLSQGEIEGRREKFIDAAFEGSIDRAIRGEARLAAVDRMVRGGYPEVVIRPPRRRQPWFGSYVATVLDRDVRDLASIERLSAMPRLLSLLATRSAQLLNLAELSRSAQIPLSTLQRYFAYLQATFLIQLLPAWAGNLGKRLLRSPKLHICDSGLLSHLLDLSSERIQDQPDLLGPLLETFVLAELRKQTGWSKVQPALYHFRSVSGEEVDTVMEDRRGRIVGLEIKASTRVSERDLRGLRFLRDSTKDRFIGGIVLYLGQSVVPLEDRITAVPVNALWA
jgi:uncharacterized protein